MRCRRCGNVNTPDSQFCICCGMPQIPSEKSAKDPVDNLIVTLGIVVIFLLIAVIGTTIYKNIDFFIGSGMPEQGITETITDSAEEAPETQKTEKPAKKTTQKAKTPSNGTKTQDGKKVIMPGDTLPEGIEAAKKPAEKKPAEKKPAEKKPAEKKPVDSNNGIGGGSSAGVGDANLD